MIIYCKLPFGNNMKKTKTKKNKAKKTKIEEIYLDYASATPISKAVLASMASVEATFANPGGIHRKSVEARLAVQDARAEIAKNLGSSKNEIIFTGSATESNTLAIVGAVNAWRKIYPDEKPHIIVSAIEHSSIMSVVDDLSDNGAEVSFLSVDEYGVVNLSELKSLIKANTVIVSIMTANNEIGTIEPIMEIAKIIRRYKKENNFSGYPLLHTDTSQAFQFLPIKVAKPEVDLLTMSSGKIYGPRGIALLYVKKNILIEPIIPGGGQEDGLRGGTEATSLIVGFAKAVEETSKLREKESLRLRKIFDNGILELAKKIPQAILLGPIENRLPNNLTFSIPNIEGDYLVLALSAKNIFASSRSACQNDERSGGEFDSHVIMSIGRNQDDGVIRLSFGRNTKMKDVQLAIKVLASAVETWSSWAHAHK